MIYYDVTDLIRSAQKPATGIQRVILEGLRRLGSDGVPVFMSPLTHHWYVLRNFDASDLHDLSSFDGLWERADLVAFPTRSNIRLYLDHTAAEGRRRRRQKALHSKLAALPFFRRALNRRASQFVRPAAWEARAWPQIERLPEIGGTDTFVLFGTPWHSLPVYDRLLASLPPSVERVFLVYDLIPINSQFVPDGLRDVFHHFIPFVLRHATHVIANSDSAASDLRSFAQARGLRTPAISKINLAHHMPPPVRPLGPGSLRVRKLFVERYALCVGSIESRKNQINLLVTWGKFVRSADYDGQKLVLAGSWLWDFEYLRSVLENSAYFDGTVVFIESPDDEELRHLYAYCRFTAYPSHYEGWGLPVGESLSFGKPCLHFDNSSLREAGRGLTDIVPYHDLSWFALAFRRLMTDDLYYRARCEAIAGNLDRLRTWDDFSQDVALLLSRLAQSQ